MAKKGEESSAAWILSLWFQNLTVDVDAHSQEQSDCHDTPQNADIPLHTRIGEQGSRSQDRSYQAPPVVENGEIKLRGATSALEPIKVK